MKYRNSESILKELTRAQLAIFILATLVAYSTNAMNIASRYQTLPRPLHGGYISLTRFIPQPVRHYYLFLAAYRFCVIYCNCAFCLPFELVVYGNSESRKNNYGSGISPVEMAHCNVGLRDGREMWHARRNIGPAG